MDTLSTIAPRLVYLPVVPASWGDEIPRTIQRALDLNAARLSTLRLPIFDGDGDSGIKAPVDDELEFFLGPSGGTFMTLKVAALVLATALDMGGRDISNAENVTVDNDLAVAGKFTAGGALDYDFRTTDLVKTSDTTYEDTLTVTVEANKNYIVIGFVNWQSHPTPDIKIRWTFPADAEIDISEHAGIENGSAMENRRQVSTAGDIIAPGSTTNRLMPMWGSIIVAGTAGDLVFQFAQLTSNANPTTVFTGSFLIVLKVN